MLEPLIEFKKVKTFQGMEGYGINADVYINGVKCYFMRDSGDGGQTDFDRYDTRTNPSIAIETNVQLLNDYIATLPPQVETFGGTTHTLKMDLELYCNLKLEHLEQERLNKKFETNMVKKMQTAILIGVPNSGSYSTFDAKKLLSTVPKTWLQTQVEMIKAKHCTQGKQILNTNLQTLGIII